MQREQWVGISSSDVMRHHILTFISSAERLKRAHPTVPMPAILSRYNSAPQYILTRDPVSPAKPLSPKKSLASSLAPSCITPMICISQNKLLPAHYSQRCPTTGQPQAPEYGTTTTRTFFILLLGHQHPERMHRLSIEIAILFLGATFYRLWSGDSFF